MFLITSRGQTSFTLTHHISYTHNPYLTPHQTTPSISPLNTLTTKTVNTKTLLVQKTRETQHFHYTREDPQCCDALCCKIFTPVVIRRPVEEKITQMLVFTLYFHLRFDMTSEKVKQMGVVSSRGFSILLRLNHTRVASPPFGNTLTLTLGVGMLKRWWTVRTVVAWAMSLVENTVRCSPGE